MPMLLRHRLSGGRLGSVQDRVQGPELSVGHDLPEVLLCADERRRHPPLYHCAVTPTTDATCVQANAGLRTISASRSSEGARFALSAVKLTVLRSALAPGPDAGAEGDWANAAADIPANSSRMDLKMVGNRISTPCVLRTTIADMTDAPMPVSSAGPELSPAAEPARIRYQGAPSPGA